MPVQFIVVPIEVPDRVERSPTSRERAEKARDIYNFRRRRAQDIPADLIGEPGWDILLLAYFLDADEKPVSIQGICAGCGVSATSGLRWIGTLERRGWLVRVADSNDRRRFFVRMSDEGREAMDRVIDRLP